MSIPCGSLLHEPQESDVTFVEVFGGAVGGFSINFVEVRCSLPGIGACCGASVGGNARGGGVELAIWAI